MRLTGLKGRVKLGTTSGGTEVYSSIDLFNWELTTQSNLEETSALDDDWKTFELLDGEYELTADKFVTTQITLKALADRITSKATVYWEADRGGTTAVGPIVANGTGYITKANYQNPRAAAKETFAIKGTGALVVAAS